MAESEAGRSMRFMETEDGKSVKEDRARNMREFARSIWVSFAQCQAAPSLWEEVRLEFKDSYFREMRHRFLEFRLCESNWKADFVAKEEYLRWFTMWQKRKFQSAPDSEGFNSEEFLGDSDTQPEAVDGKRFRVDSMKMVAKRSKHDVLVSCRCL